MNDNILLNGEFADFDTSMRVKQLGFNQPCLRYYDKHGKQCQSLCVTQTQYNEQVCSAPLWTQVALFLGEDKTNDYQSMINHIRAKVIEKHKEEIKD